MTLISGNTYLNTHVFYHVISATPLEMSITMNLLQVLFPLALLIEEVIPLVTISVMSSQLQLAGGSKLAIMKLTKC